MEWGSSWEARALPPTPQCEGSSGVGRNSWVAETHPSQILVGSRFIFYWSVSKRTPAALLVMMRRTPRGGGK